MDSDYDLDYILESREYRDKLGAALDSPNIANKQQIFNTLSALCEFNTEAYARAIETLDFYKNLKKERYRFKIVINELEQASALTPPPLEYLVSLVSFINCVINYELRLHERIRIRNEFIGLKVVPLLNNLRKVARSGSELLLQLDTFNERLDSDEVPSLQSPDGINLNSHQEVFFATLRQLADKPQEGPFLSILQHLLRVDVKEPLSDLIWDTAERLVHRATLIESPNDAVRLLRQQSIQNFTCPNCRGTGQATSPLRKASQPHITVLVSKPPADAAPPPCPMGKLNALPPPPPPPSMGAAKAIVFSQQTTPVAPSKMRTLNWSKIPDQKVLSNPKAVWQTMSNMKLDMGFNVLHDLFSLKPTGAQGSSNGHDTLDRKTKKEAVITLLDGKRSLNVNIFLKHIQNSNKNIVHLIHDGDHAAIGAEGLKGLLKILPEKDELDIFNSFNGDKSKLGSAEKFIVQLLEVPNYELRIESMLLREDFAANTEYLEPCINTMIVAGERLLSNQALQEVLFMVVVAGNFLNSGGYAGNAAGVKISSLQKLTDLKANIPGMNLLHFVVLEAERRNPELLQFPTQLNTLESASKITMEQINNDISAMDSRISSIKTKIEKPETDEDIKKQMLQLLQDSKLGLSELQERMKQVEQLRLRLAEFFCEDANNFKLEECFKIFHNFCDKFKKSIQENEKRVQMEKKAALRKKQQEERMANRNKQLGQAGTPISDSDSNTGDVLYEPYPSPRLGKRFLGSGELIRLEQENSGSPDVTPNGTMKKRKPRGMFGGGDEILHFLNSSTDTPENKHSRLDLKAVYGSLDRSWSRHARSNSLKRSDLLSNGYGLDRERASSPAPSLQLSQPNQSQQSPLVRSGSVTPATTPGSDGQANLLHQLQSEQATATHEDVKPRISREIHQKIKTWLQSNEIDEKQNEEYKRKRRLVNANRRSLENDTENERKLDPLPEEKIMPSTASTITTTTTTSSTASTNLTNPTNLQNQQVQQEQEKSDRAAGSYQRVYADWKPTSTVEHTNQNMADADAASTKVQPHLTTAEELRQYRRQRSQEQSQSPSALQSIAEEERRKSIIQMLGESDSTCDRLKLYMRRPTVSNLKEIANASMQKEESKPVTATQHADPFASLLDHHKSHNESKEIDADNIETPPVQRRIIATPSTTLISVSLSEKAKEKTIAGERADTEAEQDAPGHFDRYALERRTRRHKRPTEYSSGNEELVTPPRYNSEIKQSASANEIRRLQKEQEQLKREEQGQDQRQDPPEKARTIAKLEKVGRQISSINQEDVREAIKNLKVTGSGHHHELNDEGFEETQSLVSDTPSHGKGESTNSSCNEANEAPAQRLRPQTKQKTSTTSFSVMGMGNRLSDRLQQRPRGTSASPAPVTTNSRTQHVQVPSYTTRRSQSTHRMPNGGPMPSTTPLRSSSSSSASVSAAGVRRDPSQQRTRDAERSSSRNSSRSSINSAKSAQTVVRRLPLVQRTTTASVDSSPSKRPLTAQNTARTGQGVTGAPRGVPASRSSSSGSSVGANLVRAKLANGTRATQPQGTQPLGNSTSFKENQTTITPSGSAIANSRTAAARSPRLVRNVLNQQQLQQQQGRSSNSSSAQQVSRPVSFMRPTASSATKRQK